LEYGYFTLKGKQVDNLPCEQCNNDTFNVKGIIKYVFVFLEYLPVFPVTKSVILSCTNCNEIIDRTAIESSLYKSIKKNVFKFYFVLPMYVGLLFFLSLLGYWQYLKHEENTLTKAYIHSPQKNDFYFINYEKINDNIRPTQKYRLGKVVSVNDGLISMIYGGFTYTRSSSLIRDVQGGMTYDARYFNHKEHSFTLDELQNLYADNAILAIKRPKNNRLYGNVVIDSISINRKYSSIAEMHNDRGLAFMRYSHIASNLENAYKHFSLSSEGGLSKGQVNLSKLYIGASDINKALYWLDKAAIQGNYEAIRLYIEHCNVADGCDKKLFISKLEMTGFDLSLN